MAGVAAADRGLLEELLSGEIGRAALLARLMQFDADPCWPRELQAASARIRALRATLGISFGGDSPDPGQPGAGFFSPSQQPMGAA